MVDHISDPALAIPGPVEVIVKIDDLVARFVTVPVPADTAPNVMRTGDIFVHLDHEKRIEPRFEQVAPRFVDITLHIVRYIPGILQRKTLR